MRPTHDDTTGIPGGNGCRQSDGAADFPGERDQVSLPRGGHRGWPIGLFQVDGIDNIKLGQWLFNQHRIVNTPIDHAEFKGIRITPNVYTTLDEIDLFADKVLEAAKKGIPS